MKSGDIWLVGSGQTASWFLEQGCLDRVELTTVPVVLGSGVPLFPSLVVPYTFDLVSSRVGPQAIVITVYAKRS